MLDRHPDLLNEIRAA
ncbi:MAG: type II toxin-antitoxin system MqsA family antitoxin [Betaproteobacteria bacterium]|nr:type II toxin-antitoxin system MqsA family antitoxin [Betaproteobacteria bacterium]